MNPVIQALRNNPKAVLVKNIEMSPTDVEALADKLKLDGRKGVVAGTFTAISDLTSEHIAHFKSTPYLFRPLPGTLYGGMVVDETAPYIHIVLMNEEVLDYILSLKL